MRESDVGVSLRSRQHERGLTEYIPTMGMFDYVDYPTECPRCGGKVTEWQSKDGPCTLDRLTPRDVLFFYQTCPHCSSWLEANVVVESYHVKVTRPRAKPGEQGYAPDVDDTLERK